MKWKIYRRVVLFFTVFMLQATNAYAIDLDSLELCQSVLNYDDSFVENENAASVKLSGEIIKNDEGNIFGIRLVWNPVATTNVFAVIRTTNDLEYVKEFKGIDATHFIDIDVLPNNRYTYEVYYNSTFSNEYKVNLIEMQSLGYVGADNQGCIELVINDPVMYVNGKKQYVDSDKVVSPILVDDRTMVPIRAIIEAMHGRVGWDNASRTVTLTSKTSEVKLTIDNKIIKVNGAEVPISVPAMISDGRTRVPVIVLENMGCEVIYRGATKSIYIKYSLDF